jgi:hypothetical protein
MSRVISDGGLWSMLRARLAVFCEFPESQHWFHSLCSVLLRMLR